MIRLPGADRREPDARDERILVEIRFSNAVRDPLAVGRNLDAGDCLEMEQVVDGWDSGDCPPCIHTGDSPHGAHYDQDGEESSTHGREKYHCR